MSIKKAGIICGNPLRGLCERVCIEVNKVFDGCITRFEDEVFTATVTGELTPPYTYTGARSNGTTQIRSLSVTQIEGTLYRVRFETDIPVTISYTDAQGNAGTAQTTITLSRDLSLNLPTEALVPYEIKSSAGLLSTIGSFNGNEVSFRACVVQVVKVVAPVDLLVPTYGYCEYPECSSTRTVCEQINNIPLFPTLN